MKHLFVPYELAVKLKEKGFDEECLGYFDVDKGYTLGYYLCYREESFNSFLSEGIAAPLYQQVLDWLREKHDIHIELPTGGHPKKYYVFVHKMDGGWIYEGNNQKEFDYYDGLEAGINEALKLI